MKGKGVVRTRRLEAPVREAAMGRRILLILLALLVFSVVLLAAGCTASRQAVRRDGDVIEVRLPPAESVDVRLLREPAYAPPAFGPPAVSDESRGRWLTLFEMDVTPSEAAGVPSPPPESP